MRQVWRFLKFSPVFFDKVIIQLCVLAHNVGEQIKGGRAIAEGDAGIELEIIVFGHCLQELVF